MSNGQSLLQSPSFVFLGKTLYYLMWDHYIPILYDEATPLVVAVVVLSAVAGGGINGSWSTTACANYVFGFKSKLVGMLLVTQPTHFGPDIARNIAWKIEGKVPVT